MGTGKRIRLLFTENTVEQFNERSDVVWKAIRSVAMISNYSHEGPSPTSYPEITLSVAGHFEITDWESERDRYDDEHVAFGTGPLLILISPDNYHGQEVLFRPTSVRVA